MDGSWCGLTGKNTFVGLTLNPYPDANGDFQCWLANRERVAIPLSTSAPSDIFSMLSSAVGQVWNGR